MVRRAVALQVALRHENQPEFLRLPQAKESSFLPTTWIKLKANTCIVAEHGPLWAPDIGQRVIPLLLGRHIPNSAAATTVALVNHSQRTSARQLQYACLVRLAT